MLNVKDINNKNASVQQVVLRKRGSNSADNFVRIFTLLSYRNGSGSIATSTSRRTKEEMLEKISEINEDILRMEKASYQGFSMAKSNKFINRSRKNANFSHQQTKN